MSRSELEVVVCAVLTTALGRAIHPGAAVDRLNEERWTSLKHIEILFMVEQELGIRFTPDQVVRLNSLAELLDLAWPQMPLGGTDVPADGVVT